MEAPVGTVGSDAVGKIQQGETVDFGPIGGDDGEILADLMGFADDFFFIAFFRAGNDGEIGMFQLIADQCRAGIQLRRKVGAVDYGNNAADLHGVVFGGVGNGGRDVVNIGKTRGFDDDAVGREGFADLNESRGECRFQRTADTTAGHFRYADAFTLKEAAVDADGAEFVFQHGDVFAEVGFLKQFIDEGRFARAEKAGDDIDLYGFFHRGSSL